MSDVPHLRAEDAEGIARDIDFCYELGAHDIGRQQLRRLMELLNRSVVSPRPRSQVTKRNAETIRDCISAAQRHLISASGAMDNAVALAELDYDHNADKVKMAKNLLDAAMSILGPEQWTWDDYARNRPEEETTS